MKNKLSDFHFYVYSLKMKNDLFIPKNVTRCQLAGKFGGKNLHLK